MRVILSILQALHEAEVDCVVVGGVAVVLRGHPRMTIDLDLALDLSAANAAAVVDVLTAQGLRPRLPVPAAQFADPRVREEWVRQRNLVAFTLHDPNDAMREVDLLASSPIPYAELRAAADELVIDGVPVMVASVVHLIEMKRQTGRPQDLADVAALVSLAEGPGDDRRP